MCELQFGCLCHLQDMTTLSYLNEPGVLWNLKCRYVLDTIYTYTGSILIAVNPFQRLPHLYGPHMMEQYRGRALGELDPHVYAIADSAYRQMRTEGKSQSILVRSAWGPVSRDEKCMQHRNTARFSTKIQNAKQYKSNWWIWKA